MRCIRVMAICGVTAATAVVGVEAQADLGRLRALEQERLRSLVEADMEVARRLHADDFQLITPTGGTVSKEQYLGLVASGVVDYLEWVSEDIDVKLFGDAAVLRYRATLRIVVEGEPDAPSGRFWHTDLYEKRNGEWQVVWSQATEIRP